MKPALSIEENAMTDARRNYPGRLRAFNLGLLLVLAWGLWSDLPAAPFSENSLTTIVTSRLPVRLPPLSVQASLDAYTRNATSGGPGKDGIPAIDEPRFISADQADKFLDPNDVVFGVVSSWAAKAYPQRILVWHEIVNDQFDGENISVTYCPLTGTAVGFKRGGTTLGVSGNLINNNVVMYDRASDSLWPQILATAVTGAHKGESLQEFRVIWTLWKHWKKKYPNTTVLSTDTGYARNYRRDPYGSYNPLGGYYTEKQPPLFPLMHTDARLKPKDIVIGARDEAGAIAFRKSALREKKIIHGSIAGTHYTAFYEPGLDTAYIYKNPARTPFSYRQGRIENGNGQWQAEQMPLERINAFDAMWFAWAAFYPKTALYD